MAKETLELHMNYPPGAVVDVWTFGSERKWKEAIVAERHTRVGLMGGIKTRWTLKLKGDGEYLTEKEVSDPTEMRLRMEGNDGKTNRNLIEEYKNALRSDIALHQRLLDTPTP